MKFRIEKDPCSRPKAMTRELKEWKGNYDKRTRDRKRSYWKENVKEMYLYICLRSIYVRGKGPTEMLIETSANGLAYT